MLFSFASAGREMVHTAPAANANALSRFLPATAELGDPISAVANFISISAIAANRVSAVPSSL